MTTPPDTRLSLDENYSIGDVATLTGIAPDTIRIWERRYGRPRPTRLESGHRRYDSAQVTWLRQVACLLALGHRPSAVVGLDDSELTRLIEQTSPVPANPAVEKLVEWTVSFDGAAIRLALRRHWTEFGARGFLLEIVAPTLQRIGEGWMEGSFHIRHERFLTNILEDELRSLRTALTEADTGPLVVFATLPGEDHSLGLQLAAFLGVLGGLRAEILGTGVPLEQIAEAAEETGATAVAISVSLATGGVDADRTIAQLRDTLPEGVQLIVGGQGARGVRRGPRGIEYMGSFDQFENWIKALSS